MNDNFLHNLPVDPLWFWCCCCWTCP